ncbi:MAG: diaminopimelate decarboxylase, partial [candidate division WOR-3 bacterium]
MNFFNYRDGSLFCEDIPLEQIGERFGTPCYVYSYQTLARHYHRLVKAWRPVEFILTYAVKANSNIAILRTFKKFGAWADVVSGGEIYRALRAGFSPDRIIFGGVGKTEKEIDYAVKRNIFMIVIDSEEELDVVAQTARRNKIRVNVDLRINPDINPRTHRYIATGL